MSNLAGQADIGSGLRAMSALSRGTAPSAMPCIVSSLQGPLNGTILGQGSQQQPSRTSGVQSARIGYRRPQPSLNVSATFEGCG